MRVDRRTWFGGVVGVSLTALMLVATVGCDRSQLLRGELEAKQADWSAQIATLRGWQAKNAERFNGIRVGPSDDRDRAANRVRIAAAIEGSRQALFDVELKAKEESAEIASAIRRGSADGEEALRQADERMGGYFRGEEQELRQAEQSLALLAAR